MTSLLPSHGGLLPYFLLYTSISALAHSLVCYTKPSTTSILVFSGPNRPELSPLLAHTYAVKNFYTGLIRGLAAYHITNPDAYHLGIASFVGVVWLYGTECFYYRTVNFNVRGALIPLVQAGSGIVWMLMQRRWYLG